MQANAYREKDTIAFKTALHDFNHEYKKLSEDQKQNYLSYYQNGFYNLACTYALLNKAGLAIKYLKKAINSGYKEYYHLLEDEDLKRLHDQEEYKLIISQLRSTQDYLYILGKADTYNTDEHRDLPKFSYQNSTDPNLVFLRKEFNLDSIAGGGNEVSRIINLMHWVHNKIPHDGKNENPAVYNASDLIAICIKDKRGLNCRGLTTILNECYLAMGYKSRLVTCLPKDSLGVDVDCHVINIVFSKSLNKWIWMDATNNAYVMDDKGTLLGIEEVRKRLISGETLIVNPDANWNNKSSVIIDDYLYQYMAKNLYRFESPVMSTYNLEKRKVGETFEYIQLLPLDYFKQQPIIEKVGNPKKEPIVVRYKTNGPNIFWCIP